jgi:3-keto-disaccharide hydrolase
VGQTYNVWLNNTQIITDFKGTRSPEGYIGLQNHGNPVTFRKVLIEPLPVWATSSV